MVSKLLTAPLAGEPWVTASTSANGGGRLVCCSIASSWASVSSFSLLAFSLACSLCKACSISTMIALWSFWRPERQDEAYILLKKSLAFNVYEYIDSILHKRWLYPISLFHHKDHYPTKNIYIFVLGRWFKLKYATLSLHHIVPGVINFVIWQLRLLQMTVYTFYKTLKQTIACICRHLHEILCLAVLIWYRLTSARG